MRRNWIILLILASVPRGAAAQQLETAPGARIRVTHTCHVADDGSVRCDSGSYARHWRDTGTFVEVRNDTLVLQTAEHQNGLRLPLTAVQRLEIPDGQESRWKRGSTIGTVLGAVAGGVVGGANGADDFAPKEAHVAGGIILGAVAGFAVGAITGSLFKTEHWVSQPILAMGLIEPQCSTKAYAMSIRFRF